MTLAEQGWWGERWLAWLGALQVGPETDGQVKSAQRAEGEVRLQTGQLSARVRVGERKWVEAVFKVKPWNDKDWRRALEAIAQQPELAQRVLSGTMGAELEFALADVKLALFPDKASLGCNCGARDVRCRHLNFLALQAAALLDENPFRWLEMLGRSRAQLLADLRGRLADRGRPAGRERPEPTDEGEVALTAPSEGEPLDPARFWEGEVDPATIPVRPGGSVAPDGLIRSLGPLGVAESLFLLPSREPLATEEYIGRMVAQVGQTASALALGEVEPLYRAGLSQGKPVSLASRLADELVEVIRAEGVMLPLDELAERCPTAGALEGERGVRKALQEACAHLPSDLVLAGGRYVGPAAVLLRGAVLRHVLTFDEWRAGELDRDADWVRALGIAGWEPPAFAELLERLQPEVGDELWLHLGGPSLEVSHIRRRQRGERERLQSDRAAVQFTLGLIGMSPAGRVTEEEVVGALLAEGGYREGMNPDPVWLLPLLGPELAFDPATRALSRGPGSWRPGFPRFVYGVWPGRQSALITFQARLMRQGLSRREVEAATACVEWWSRLWPGAQDIPEAAESFGPFLHFLWNVAPREAGRQRIPLGSIPSTLDAWFAFLEERVPGLYERHRAAVGLAVHYAERCRTLPAETSPELLGPWLAEGFRWMGPLHFMSGGAYRA